MGIEELNQLFDRLVTQNTATFTPIEVTPVITQAILDMNISPKSHIRN